MSNQDLLFSKFVQFVEDLNNVFGAKFKSIKMYHIVVNKLKELHESETNSGDTKERIDQHVKILCDFIKENREQLNYDWYVKIRPEIMLMEQIPFNILMNNSINARARQYTGPKKIMNGMSVGGEGWWNHVKPSIYNDIEINYTSYAHMYYQDFLDYILIPIVYIPTSLIVSNEHQTQLIFFD
jgi:hypothetical protein